MLEKSISKYVSLYADEEIKNIVHQSWWYYFWQLLVIIVLVLVPFFLIYPLFQRGWFGIGCFLILVLVGMGMAIRLFYVYNHTAFIMTTNRIIDIDQRGFFSRTISEALYDRIQNVSSKTKGVFKSITKIGDINIDLSGTTGGQITKIKLKTVRRPQEIVGMIMRLQEDFVKAKTPNNKRAIKLLERIKKKLGPDKLARLIAD